MHINQGILKKFIKLAEKKLTGKWVIMGGAVLPLMGIEYRITNDIDIAGPKKSTQRDMLVLMEIAQTLGLPIEAINQAGAFFLHKIENWEKHLIVVSKKEKVTFYRPNATLFLLLKISRLTESDLQDCFNMLKFEKDEIDKSRIQKEIKTVLKKNTDSDKTNRMKLLLAHPKLS